KTIGPGTSGGIYTVCGNGITVAAGATLNLNPGVYIINTSTSLNSGVQVQNGGTLTGSGVTIILTSSNNKYGNFDVGGTSGTGTVNLTAPTTGSTAGVAVY